ncbi:hypothetical protein [Pseudochryseolinea flava]|uniref:Uncharacterized protein n=1 Tax=Pseudochryseolinea flava TaxID=2059302 RepID=A0A364XVZ4_9BACT|nr:hypothetical protein [Pseudochryseolinea flava]RAV97892.1 hypothetical protein DQQ10_26415 [Pseudochryseolinea flava]
MNFEQDPIEHIKYMLENKSTAKQTTFKNILSAYSTLLAESKNVVDVLSQKAHPADHDVTLGFTVMHEHEFQVKLAGDLVIFVLGTNIVTFEDNHPIMQDEYIKEKEVNRYFGQIMIYDFMSDSLKYNRTNDPGYLLARILINHENRFFIEGEKQLKVYEKISDEPISEKVLTDLARLCLVMAIENDLVASPYQQVKSITLSQKLDHAPELSGAKKIGFRMSYEQKTEA